MNKNNINNEIDRIKNRYYQKLHLQTHRSRLYMTSDPININSQKMKKTASHDDFDIVYSYDRKESELLRRSVNDENKINKIDTEPSDDFGVIYSNGTPYVLIREIR